MSTYGASLCQLMVPLCQLMVPTTFSETGGGPTILTYSAIRPNLAPSTWTATLISDVTIPVCVTVTRFTLKLDKFS